MTSSLYLRGQPVGERSQDLAKRWGEARIGQHRRGDPCAISVSVPLAALKCPRSPPSTNQEHAPTSSLPLNSPNPEQDPFGKNYNENMRPTDHHPREIFRTPTDASAPPPASLVGPLGSLSFTIPIPERALEEMEGKCTCLTLGTLGFGRRAGVLNLHSTRDCRTSLRAC